MELEEIDKVNRAMWRWRSSITAWALEGPQHTNPVRSDKGYYPQPGVSCRIPLPCNRSNRLRCQGAIVIQSPTNVLTVAPQVTAETQTVIQILMS